MARGYKLHAVADSLRGFVAWTVTPLNVSEKLVARELVEKLEPGGHLIGDNNYDSNVLYDLAGQRSIQMLTPRRKQAKGLGHHRHSLHRLEGLRLLQTEEGQQLLKQRVGIERRFGQITNLGFGLKPLPNWVRGLHRVRSWVQGKIILYQLWLHRDQKVRA
jgi:hypothetical protein